MVGDTDGANTESNTRAEPRRAIKLIREARRTLCVFTLERIRNCQSVGVVRRYATHAVFSPPTLYENIIPTVLVDNDRRRMEAGH